MNEMKNIPRVSYPSLPFFLCVRRAFSVEKQYMSESMQKTSSPFTPFTTLLNLQKDRNFGLFDPSPFPTETVTNISRRKDADLGRRRLDSMDVDSWASRVHAAKSLSAVHAARMHYGTSTFLTLFHFFICFSISVFDLFCFCFW